MLSAEGLQKSFRTRQVVRDFAFSIREGEVVGLLGPNGAGKTTCFYMIVGLIDADACPCQAGYRLSASGSLSISTPDSVGQHHGGAGIARRAGPAPAQCGIG